MNTSKLKNKEDVMKKERVHKKLPIMQSEHEKQSEQLLEKRKPKQKPQKLVNVLHE